MEWLSFIRGTILGAFVGAFFGVLGKNIANGLWNKAKTTIKERKKAKSIFVPLIGDIPKKK